MFLPVKIKKFTLLMPLLMLSSWLLGACGDSTPLAGGPTSPATANSSPVGQSTQLSTVTSSTSGPASTTGSTATQTTNSSPSAATFSPTTAALSTSGSTAGTGANPSHPNIIFLLTDDLDASEIQFMPKLKALLEDQGLTFSDYFVTDSLCCPSRSSIQRGQYVHNHQVLGNQAPAGGFQKFYQVGDQNSTIGTWMKDDGYRTALMGKYLNGYPDTATQNYIPPGWDEWDSPVDNSAYSEFNYKLNENGNIVSYGNQPQDYLTDVLSNKATNFIKQSVSSTSSAPFFLYLASYAPHQPATPAPRDANLFPNAMAPRTASFNEADVSDKPNYIKNLPLLTTQQINQIDELYRKRLESLRAVDDLIGNLYDTLKATNQLDNTYFFFSSDNGFHLGQHRMQEGKQTPYDEDIHVPLIVRGPGIPAGKTSDAMALEIDLAPTFAQLGSAKTPGFVDGRSLVPLLNGAAAPADWRKGVLIEHYFGSSEPFQSPFEDQQTGTDTTQTPTSASANPTTPATEVTTTPTAAASPAKNSKKLRKQTSGANATVTAGAGQTTPQASGQAKGGKAQGKGKGKNKTKKTGGTASSKMIPTYKAFRTADYLYVEYSTGEKELYNLKTDPAELDNQVTTADPNLLKQFSSQLADMSKCSADSCRATEAK